MFFCFRTNEFSGQKYEMLFKIKMNCKINAIKNAKLDIYFKLTYNLYC